MQENQIEKSATTLPAKTYDNPWLQVAAECGNNFGKLLKFVKGVWKVGDDEVPLGTEYICHIDQLAKGWVHFEDGALVDDPIIIKVCDGLDKLPERGKLGNNDKKKWEKNADGIPLDPWVLQWYLPLVTVESNELHTFVTSSDGGDQAVGNLAGVYGSRPRNGLLPIVALAGGSYFSRKYKSRVEYPQFNIVSWHGAPTQPTTQSQPAAGGNPNADMNDELPY